jgi:signal transduction histidine kinase
VREHVRSDLALSAEDRQESAVDRDAADDDRRASARARSVARHDRGEAAVAAEQALETLETMTDAFVRLDAAGRFTYLNPQTEEILQQRPDALLGCLLADVLPEMARRMEHVLEHAPAQSAPVHFEVDETAPGGRVLDCRVVRTDDGLSIYFRDVTVQRRSEDARQDVPAPVALDLNDALRRASAALKASLPPGVTLQLDYAQRPVAAYLDPTQLDVVLLNLVANSRDAMDGAGAITITVTARGSAPSDPSLSSGWLQVTDTGCGIADDLIPRLFEPYVASEPHERGTGPGLATVHGIVRRNGGFISVDSSPGRGTTFTIAVPSGPTNHDELDQGATAAGSSRDTRPSAEPA